MVCFIHHAAVAFWTHDNRPSRGGSGSGQRTWYIALSLPTAICVYTLLLFQNRDFFLHCLTSVDELFRFVHCSLTVTAINHASTDHSGIPGGTHCRSTILTEVERGSHPMGFGNMTFPPLILARRDVKTPVEYSKKRQNASLVEIQKIQAAVEWRAVSKGMRAQSMPQWQRQAAC